MTGDQWHSHPLKWLQVSLQGYPPCLICRRVPVGPRHPLISRQRGKEALLSKSSTATFEWQYEGDGPAVIKLTVAATVWECAVSCCHSAAVRNPITSSPHGSIVWSWSWFDMSGPSSPNKRKGNKINIRWNQTIFIDHAVGLVFKKNKTQPLKHLQMLSKGGPCLHWGAAQTKRTDETKWRYISFQQT